MSQWFECEQGHKMALTGDPEALKRKAAKVNHRGQAQIVCPRCKADPDAPPNVRLAPCEPDENAIVDQYSKKYACKHGHVTVVYPFTNGTCNVSWGEDGKENVEADPDTMMALIDEGHYRCQDTIVNAAGKKRRCNCKIKGLDNAPLETPNAHGIKTRVRVGDIWDKAGCPEAKVSEHKIVKKGGVTDAEYHETEFSRRMKKRAKDKGIWVYNPETGKQEKIKKRRITEEQGKVVRKPTKKSYRGGRNPRKPSQSEIDKV